MLDPNGLLILYLRLFAILDFSAVLQIIKKFRYYFVFGLIKLDGLGLKGSFELIGASPLLSITSLTKFD